MFADPFSKSRGFAGHLALSAIEMKWRADNDNAYIVRAALIAQPCEVATPIHTRPSGQRTRNQAQRIGHRQTYPTPAIVDRQNGTARRVIREVSQDGNLSMARCGTLRGTRHTGTFAARSTREGNHLSIIARPLHLKYG
jgi:hypothetical protein